MSKRALILYYSTTGNTQKIALCFRTVLEEFEWEVTEFRLGNGKVLADEDIYFDDFNLVLLGSPVHSCAPANEVSELLAPTETEPPRTVRLPYKIPEFQIRPEMMPLGIVFVTYSGNNAGPKECTGALNMLEMYLNLSAIDVIGSFACPGKPEQKGPLDILAKELNCPVSIASQILSYYESDPFKLCGIELSEDAYALLEQCHSEKAASIKATTYLEEIERMWHKDATLRPHKRDLLKARIFLEEILEDYFREPEVRRYARPKYISIG